MGLWMLVMPNCCSDSIGTPFRETVAAGTAAVTLGLSPSSWFAASLA